MRAHTTKRWANPAVNESGSLQHFFYALLIPRGDKPSAEPAAPGATSPTLPRRQQCGLPHFMCVNLFKPIDTSSCQSGQRFFKRGVARALKSGCETTLTPPPPLHVHWEISHFIYLMFLCDLSRRARETTKGRLDNLGRWENTNKIEGRKSDGPSRHCHVLHLRERRKTSLLGGLRMCAWALWERKESHLYFCSFTSCPSPFIKWELIPIVRGNGILNGKCWILVILLELVAFFLTFFKKSPLHAYFPLGRRDWS